MADERLIGEALRYLGAGERAPEDMRAGMAALAAELEARIRPRHALRVLDITRAGDALTLGGGALPDGLTLPGQLARTVLAACDRAALLVCTLGPTFDAWMRALQARDMARAVMLDALGSAWVEAGCDAAERALMARLPGKHLTDRFSPGYGDLPLTLQSALLEATDAPRYLGVSATESCLLIPQKTVTAIIGIADTPQPARIRGCGACPLRERCASRKGGKNCDL